MQAVLFTFLGIHLYSYGLMIALAFLAGYWLISKVAMRFGENPEPYLASALWFIIAGIAGARLFYFFWYPQLFWANPVRAVFNQGGLVWYGGLIGVILAILLYTRLRKMPILHFMDVLSPAAALGLGIGRIGCFLAGCCYGSVTRLPWAVHFPLSHETHGLPVHPVQLYETVLMGLTCLVLLKLGEKPRPAGFIAFLFLMSTSLVRFLLEYLRGDRLLWMGALDLSASQIISLVGFTAGSALFWMVNQRAHGKKKSLASG